MSEQLGHKTVTIGVVHLIGGTATLSRALIWRCAQLHRKVVASTLSPAQRQQTSVTITTPSCSKRLASTVASHSGVRRTIRINLHDLWGTGLLHVRICLTGPGARVSCRPASLQTGQQRTLGLTVSRSGRWNVSIDTQFGQKVTAIAWVI